MPGDLHRLQQLCNHELPSSIVTVLINIIMGGFSGAGGVLLLLVAMATVSTYMLREVSAAEEVSLIKTIRGCFSKEHVLMCLKEQAITAIDQTIRSDKAMQMAEFLQISKDPGFQRNISDIGNLPTEVTARNEKLNSLLVEKVDEFFQSRNLKLSLSSLIEGRGKKGGMKGMMMMGGLAMAGMVAQLMMGKVAMMSGAALMMAKMALLISALMGLKRMMGGGGSGHSENVVYASSGGDYGGGHGGGGGWHRSLEGDAQQMAYKAQAKNGYAY